MNYVYNYVKANGISTESAYPYKAVGSTCRKTSTARAGFKISGYQSVAGTNDAYKAALDAQGPMSIALDAGGTGF